MTKSLVLLLSLFIQTGIGMAVTSDLSLMEVDINIRDHASLQRGAKLFMNYCSGCHSLKYMRYNRMAKDMGLTNFDGEVDKNLLYNNLIFTKAKKHEPVNIAMPREDSREWFGIEPPDLSLIARKRGANWLYTYLQSFYEDKSRPFGANNLLIPGVAMPNVLEPLQGRVVAVNKKTMTKKNAVSHLLLIEKGSMTQYQFDSAIADIVTFLVYVGEPAQLIRYDIGIWVLGFLFIFLVFAYKLKKAYWKQLKD